MGEEKKGVKLFGMWASPFSLRVEWALRLKGVEYEFVNENLPHEKSPELLRYNPITKKVPTLVHDGRSLAESLVIIEYIDEVWTGGHPIMPQDPYHRSQARFWAKFAKDKCAPAAFKVYMAIGEELKKAVEEYQEVLRTLDQALEAKRFFGGDRIGFLDLAVGFFAYWIPMLEELTGISIVNDSSLPLLHGWFHRFLDVGVVKESLPPRDKLYDLLKARREQMLSGEITYKNGEIVYKN